MDNKQAFFKHIFSEENRRLQDLADGTLLTEDGCSFPVHKVALAKNSNYFTALFCGIGYGKKDVLIPGIAGEVLSDILTYIYTEEIDVTENNICDLIVASDYLLLEDLLTRLKTFMKKNLSINNCLAVHTSTLRISRAEFSRESYRFIETHFEEIVCTVGEEFCDFPLELLKQLLDDRNLRVQNESVVFRAIVKWVEADLSSRLHHAPHLLMHLKTADVDENLATEVLTHDIVAKNVFCQTISFKNATNFRNILKFHQCHIWNNRAQILPFYIQRKPLNLNFIAYYSAYNTVDGIQIFVTYDDNIDLWRKIIEVNMSPNYLLAVDDCIYLFETSENTSKCYNIIRKQWIEFRNFRILRFYYAVVELDGFLYILGGISAVTGDELYEVEIYYPEEDVWFDTMPMLPVTSFSAVTLNDSIYVVGNSPEGFEMIVQMYDPSTEIWNILPVPSVMRFDFALVVYHEKMYIIGGSDGSTHIKDVEVFDPLDNVWYSMQSLPYIYYFPKAIIVKDQLIVYDEHLQDRVYLKTNPPVKLNYDRGCWEAVDETSPMCDLHMYYFFTLQDGECMNAISKENKMPGTVFGSTPFS